MSELLPPEPKLSAKDKFLDYIASLIPMDFVIVNIDTPREEESDDA